MPGTLQKGRLRAGLRASSAASAAVSAKSVACGALSVAVLAFGPAAAEASTRLHPTAAAGAAAVGSGAAAEEARIAAYWTPERMRTAPPLDAPLSRDPFATASFAPVTDATLPPFAVNGRIFVRQGRNHGYCSGTAIDSPSRRLVLTAGHCVNSGPLGPHGSSIWSRFMEFVPAYTAGSAPFGAFVARRPEIYALSDWVRFGNPNFDLGAFLVGPNQLGQSVADAVGGVPIALDRSRKEQFESFGYPGKVRRLQRCPSPALGEDRLTFRIPGPPTVRIRCHWLPGASGGGWLINEGTEINGLTSYGRNRDTHTFGPYFSKRNVGKLVAGL